MNCERHIIKEYIHPDTCTPMYLCQFRIGDKFCPPFWDTKQNRVSLGEEAWYQGLQENAQGLLLEYGPALPLIP